MIAIFAILVAVTIVLQYMPFLSTAPAADVSKIMLSLRLIP